MKTIPLDTIPDPASRQRIYVDTDRVEETMPYIVRWLETGGEVVILQLRRGSPWKQKPGIEWKGWHVDGM